jgi:peptidoglycan/xylan/chitin deacetylase (PgdA/CDA1 family)
MHWLLGGALGLLALSHLAPFPFLLDWISRDVAIWRIPRPDGRTIYLTFDDGPNPAVTPRLLDVLGRERAHATFFLIDRYVTPETAPIVRRMFEEGHGVALHSDTRRLMLLTPAGLEETLNAAHARIVALTGHAPCAAFRPHGGGRSLFMMRGLKRSGRVLIGWGFGLWDWNWFRARRPESIVARVLRRASPGSIVVIHDGHHKNPRADRQYAVDATTALIPALRARSFEFGTICDALQELGAPRGDGALAPSNRTNKHPRRGDR